MTPLIRLRQDDSGLGMVLVLATSAVLTALMIVSTTAAIRSLTSSRQHVSFESALAVGEGGIDVVLARAQQAYSATATDSYVTPAPTDTTCPAASVTWPFTSQPTADEERAWARDQLEAVATNAGCRQRTAAGEFVVLKPVGRQTVYALAWAPWYGHSEVKRRLLKAEYLFTPYRPTHAILSNGSMVLDSSTTVTTAPGHDSSLAAVHTNGSLSVLSGNPTVYGPVTQSAPDPTATSNKFMSNTGGTVVGKSKQSVPFAGALDVWVRNRTASVPGGWYDLCPDGTARKADGSAPCMGTIYTTVGAGEFRGWKFDGSGTVPRWLASNDVYNYLSGGTYYVHHGNAVNTASNGPKVNNLSVIASASQTSCYKVGGDIDWSHTDIAAPSLDNTWFIADQDLRTSSNFEAGSASGGTVVSGYFVAGDQVELSTSSNGAYGAVIAADQCDPPDGQSMVDGNSIKNPAIYYDPNAQAPFIDVINTTLWLEYPN